jgi:hypothetical protein
MQPDLFVPAHDGSGAGDGVPLIERMANDLAAARKIIAELLRHAGVEGVCKGPNCGQKIIFVFHRDTGKLTPYNQDGTSHFASCPDRELFHKSRKGDNECRPKLMKSPQKTNPL